MCTHIHIAMCVCLCLSVYETAIYSYIYTMQSVYSYTHSEKLQFIECVSLFSGGCNLVNWLSQTRKNLTIEYLNLNFVITPKLTPLHSFYAVKVFVFCVLLIFVLRVCIQGSNYRVKVNSQKFPK